MRPRLLPLAFATAALAACADRLAPEDPTLGPAPLYPGAAPAAVPGPLPDNDVNSSTDNMADADEDPIVPVPAIPF